MLIIKFPTVKLEKATRKIFMMNMAQKSQTNMQVSKNLMKIFGCFGIIESFIEFYQYELENSCLSYNFNKLFNKFLVITSTDKGD